MKILLYSLIFYPDVCSNAYVFTDLAVQLMKMGHEVSVITTTPHYDTNTALEKRKQFEKGKKNWYFISQYKGINIYHVDVATKKGGFFTRLITFYKFQHYGPRLARVENIKADAVLGQTPPFTIGKSLKKIGNLTGGKTALIIQDLFIDSLIDEGVLFWPFSRIFKSIENKSNIKVDNIVTISNEMFEKVNRTLKGKKDISVIPNFVDTQIYHPISEDYRKKYNISSFDFVISYVGNIGTAQDLMPLIELARKDKKIKILIAGNGCDEQKYREIVEKENLSTIHFLGYVSREQTVEINSISDVCLILLDKSVQATSFPSKTYTLLAMGKPIVVSSVEDSAIGEFVVENNLGISVNCEKYEDFVDAICTLKNDKNLKERFGKNGIELVKEKFSVECVANQYCLLLGDK